MGFLSGRMTFERLWVDSPSVEALGTEHIDVLEKFAIGKTDFASADAPNVGFLAGDHLFDVNFNWEKNVINDALHFGVRIDTDTIPSALRKAWLQIEIAALLAESDSGRLTKVQKQEAKDAVEARCEEEIQSGKYRKMAQSSALWDAHDGILYLAGGEHCCELLERSFEMQLDRVTAGKIARRWATEAKKLTALEKIAPSVFHAQEAAGDVAWANHQSGGFDFLGNEFLLWLWWTLETNTDTLELPDDSEVTCMLNRTLTLECPLGESGRDSFSHEAPIKLPEAMQGIRSGKLPRKTGITLIRQGLQYDFVMQAESFAVSGAKIQVDGNDDGLQEDRIAHIRQLSETLDLLFQSFCAIRIGSGWADQLKGIRKWIQQDSTAKKRPAA